VGDWAIGVVQESFWGLPKWTPHLVLLTHFVYWKGETYFVDGDRARGWLTNMLPIVDAELGCSRTRPAQEAIVDLRVLREAPSATGTRLIGYVRQPQTFVGGLAPPSPPKFAPGARISVTGPTGTSIVTTDHSGIYQLDNLPQGGYTLQLLTAEDQVVGFFKSEEGPAKVHLDTPGPIEHNFEVFWNGRIEGHVEDDSGKPAHIWVMLLRADGSQIPGYVNSFLLTEPDGSYQINKIPPGRYILVVNPNGPYDDEPYDIQYYLSALRPENAHVLQIAEGQQIKGIDFSVGRLIERTVRVRVTLQNGAVVGAASICFAYENTKEYASLVGTNCFKQTDQNGEAVVHLYGSSRMRLFAEQNREQDTYYSHRVELGAGNIPEKINLVLSSPRP
jgi:hypothetical protein